MPKVIREDLEEFLGIMDAAVWDSEQHMREVGFRICREDGNTYTTKQCMGDACGVSLETCEAGDKTVAGFHTHPWIVEEAHPSPPIIAFLAEKKGFSSKAAGANLVPSPMDAIVALVSNEQATCLGNEKGIVCHPMKDIDDMPPRGKSIAGTAQTLRLRCLIAQRGKSQEGIDACFRDLDMITSMMGVPEKEWFFGDEIWLREP